jgi:hypothetical protein
MQTVIFLFVLLVFCHNIRAIPVSFSAQFLAQSRKDSSISYKGSINAKVHPQSAQWIIEAISTDDKTNSSYVYSNGETYFIRRGLKNCEKMLTIGPPLQENILNILNSETINVKNVLDKDVQQCIDDGLTLKNFVFEGEHFVICNSDKELLSPKRIISREVLLHITEFSTESNPILKKLVAKALNCEQVKHVLNPRASVGTTNSIPWFINYKTSCKFNWIKHDQNCNKEQPAKQQEQKTCVFLHGAGESIVGPIQNASKNYWGSVHDFVPQCSDTIFSFEDTKNNGWDNKDLQKRYCDIALSNQPDGERVVKNKVIFTHSMANLLLSAAIHNGFCDIDTSTTSWYAVDPPFHGSKAATMVTAVCQDKDPSPVDLLYQWLSHNLGYCIPDEHRAYPGTSTNQVEYCSPDGTCMKDLRAVAIKRIKGIQCGAAPHGLNTLKYSLPLSSLALIVDYGERSDGLVPISSCKFFDQDKFTNDFTSLKYQSETNHADGTCRNGDGWWGADRKPCSWFSDKELLYQQVPKIGER